MTRTGLVAILRGIRPDEAVAVGRVLVEEGIDAIEVPLNSPDPFRSIERLAAAVGNTVRSGQARCSPSRRWRGPARPGHA